MEYLQTAVNDFLQEGRRRLSPHTTTYYSSALGAFTAFCQAEGATRVEDLTKALLRRYAAALDDSPTLSAGGAHARLRAVRTFINWAVREELLERSPLPHHFFPRVPTPELPVVTDDDMEALLRVVATSGKPLRDRAILLTLFDTGLRASELCSLQLDHLLPDATLYVRLGKGGKDRRVPASKTTRRAIQKYLSHERPESDLPQVFLSSSLMALTSSGLAQLLRRLSRAAGLPEKTPHAFRRGFAVSFVKHGADLVRLRDALGHTTIAMSTRYAVMSADDLKEIHQQASPVGNLGRPGRRRER